MHPIDIVIPWVDGSDVELIEKRNKYITVDPSSRNQGPDSDVSHPSRWEDFQELKICISSIDKFAPWVRRVYVLTDGQKLPTYLPQEFVNEKVVLVDHKDTFIGIENYLPTFNSASIATSVINIKGLSDKFLLFNDDIFFTKPVVPEMFFDQTGKSILRGNFNVGMRYQKHLSWNHHMNNGAKLAGFDETDMFRLAHCCQPIDKSIVSSFRSAHQKIFDENMSYRFRNNNQFTLSSLSTHLAIKAGRAIILNNPDWVHISANSIRELSVEQLAKAFMLLQHERCFIANVNDLRTAAQKIDIVIPFIEEIVSRD